MVVARPGYVWSGTEWVPIGVAPEGSSVTDHEQLTGRADPAQHPTSAVDGLDTALAGKSESTHTHPGSVLPGPGIAIDDTNDVVTVTNTDPGSTALQSHETPLDPHPGRYSPPSHTHDYSPPLHAHPYSDIDHGHSADYDPLGQATAEIAIHAAEGNPHPGYLTDFEVIGGPGISTAPDGLGGVVVTNTAQNIGVAGIGYGQSIARVMPDQTWRGMQLDVLILATIDATSGLSVATNGFTLGAGAPEGWYQFNGAIAFSAHATGRRMVRASINDDPLRCPLIPQSAFQSLGSGLITFVPISGPVYLAPGDRISIEGWQNSGANLDSTVTNTLLSVIFTGEAY